MTECDSNITMKSYSILGLFVALLLGGCGDGGDSGRGTDAGPPPVDQCVNANDTPIVDALYADGGSGENVGRYVLNCIDSPGSACYDKLFDPDATEDEIALCLSDCTAPTDVAGLTDGCLLCYADAVPCGAEHCLVECIGDTGCLECLGMHCIPALSVCTGLPTP